MLPPEQIARRKIDSLLAAAGWTLQNPEAFNRKAALGVAVREFQLPSGACDYMLFVAGKAAGVIEAKKAGVTLSGFADQSEKCMFALPAHLAKWHETLVFDYESTGDETLFRNLQDPKPRSRKLFAFHQPQTLLGWLKAPRSLRSALTEMPPLVEAGLRDCQIEAIHGLEASLAADKPRALIQLATGAGKTFAACTFSFRLIKHAGAKRILFLVDRNNLGDQTLKEFQNYQPPGTANRFTDTYIVQHLHKRRIDPDAKVVITTIQRLYAMLRGEELEEEAEEASAYETWQDEEGAIRPVAYNPQIPIEAFDFIVTDECHRSIYGVWRQVLEYFDASIIGLTATPSMHTLGFFNQNLVAEYPYERSVVDGVNVGYEIYRIKTRVTEEGSSIEAGTSGFQVPVRDKRTRAVRYRDLDADLDYGGEALDRSVVAPNQIRTLLEAFKSRVFTELFPERSGNWLPKTLIFAKDDAHAEEIVHLVREVFGEGNDFAKKITYRNSSEDPKSLIKAFRVDPFPRVAVTVDMIATGTDIKSVEVLIFMRDVRSEGYCEQMKGRGVRTIPDADLASVTPDAKTKTRFILIDAVGVSETKKNASKPLERKRAISFDKLIDQIAQGRRDEDALSSLAGRLAALDRKLDEEDRQRVVEATGGLTPRDLANRLLDAVDPDKQQSAIAETPGPATTPQQERPVIEAIVECIAPRVGETLCDPACGTGGFLLSAYDHMKGQSQDRDKLRKLREETFTGVDIVDEVVRLAAMNLYLHGVGDGTSPVQQGDALAGDPGRRFDVVLTNPPFGKKSSYTVVGEDGQVTTERETYEREDFKFTTSNKQFNFLQHIMTILEVNGRAGVVLPDNVLFEAGRAGEGIRKRLLEGFDLHTLLRLPTGIWYSPGVKANVLFFTKKAASREAQTRALWVYDYRTNVHKTLKTKKLVHDDLNDFVHCYRERKETERFRSFGYDELVAREKLNLDIFWLKDDSLDDIDSLPEPDVIAGEIVENLEAALAQFRAVAEDLQK